MKCSTPTCPVILTVHARRRFCPNCRASMAYLAQFRPAQVLDRARRLQKFQERISLLKHRKEDIPHDDE